MPSLVKLIVIVITVGLALAAVVRVVEPRFAFFPTTGEQLTPVQFGLPSTSASLTTSDGQRLRAWLLPAREPRALIVYFHGNGGNLSVWLPILAEVQRRGFTIAAVDYRGYGVSTGQPTERGLYQDVDATVEWASQFATPRVPVVYWGRSLGAAMAAYAATKRRPDGLILEAGFPSARALLRASPPLAFLALFSSYRFPTADYARRAGVPVLVMHGDEDRVIPFANGRALYEALPEPKQFVTIRGGDHNDAAPRDPDAYWGPVAAFVDSLARSSTPHRISGLL